MRKEGVLIVPESGHFAFEIEGILKDRGVDCMVIPTPKVLSGECGVSLLVKSELLDEIGHLLEDVRRDMIKGVYLMPGFETLVAERGENELVFGEEKKVI
jgi:hypothetical protein